MEKTVAIIGAGPVGLAAAAHVMERGMSPVVLEAGPEAGHSLRQWQHVHLFSPWEYNVDKAAARLLAPTGWNSPDPAVYPTGAELLERYIEPLATRTALHDVIRTNSRVSAVGRAGFDKAKTKGRAAAPFEIRYQNGKGPETLHADAVIDASGTWGTPNPAGTGGLPAPGEREAAARIAYGMPDVLGRDRKRYSGKTVAVLGAGHSAVGTLTDLTTLAQQAPGTRPVWLLRGGNPEKAFGGGANDKLAARGELGAHFASLVAAGQVQVEAGFPVAAVGEADGRLRIQTSSGCCGRSVVVDELIVATGFRPDLSFLSEIRLRLDPAIDAPIALAPLIDPNEHSCGTVRPHGARELVQDDAGFYLAGIKSYGRAPTFLMITGYEQVRSIAADIAGDREAAERVELDLPETGVCTRGGVEGAVEASGCCGGPAPVGVSACCADDASAKAVGETGCGCS
jgi:glycine/D-amino acid oxidase-like deaminating enzyme